MQRSDELFQHAEALISARSREKATEADIRRAISSAYYGVFHFLLARAADQFSGERQESSPIYELVYRAIEHGSAKKFCNEIRKQTLQEKYRRYLPDGVDEGMQVFCKAFIELQEKRHAADYSPSGRYSVNDAEMVLKTARSAVRRFDKASPIQQKTLLALLLFQPR